jgi:hypothetical protein
VAIRSTIFQPKYIRGDSHGILVDDFYICPVYFRNGHVHGLPQATVKNDGQDERHGIGSFAKGIGGNKTGLAVLEKIITDKRYDLDEEINLLRSKH